MFEGTVNLRAAIKGKGLRFAAFDWNPNEPGVEKVVIEGPTGDYILSTVFLSRIATEDDGKEVAAKVNACTLDRLAYHQTTSIENAQITGHQFSPQKRQAGALSVVATASCHTSPSINLIVEILPARLKSELEQATPPGERFFGLFRSALLSLSPVETFMQLYNLLLMLYNDRQACVDTFIISNEPDVQQTQNPVKNSGFMETVYTRLRNEFAHTRPGVNITTTKAEMANRLGDLQKLIKKAIALHP